MNMKPGIEGLNPLDITNFYLFEGMGRNSHILGSQTIFAALDETFVA
ncbi:hypothetical protein [Methylomonas methanica]|nr:hypothetical protein [Methylomonas methanica]